MPPSITVVGTVNLDLVAQVQRLPRPGETVTDAVFRRVPSGQGANQAVVACGRLGADVTLVCSVGDDLFAAEALPQEVPATPSPPASSFRCSRAKSTRERYAAPARPGALAASRGGAQPSLPTAAEVDAILAS